ncbi:MAG TPA: antitoxin VapB family protein [Candidatus Thermoplasmatota archaeon]|nr:antitoxin VapB family protein [Candidatus Thermoplasmatota archaeon]
MARQVQLADEAYARLSALKRDGESFSDVVLRLTRPRKDPRGLAGARLFEGDVGGRS